nr:uncharacterized protein LOC112005566 isoform X3 [Quercus suber]
MSGVEDLKEKEQVDGDIPIESEKSMPSSQEEEAAVKKKYGGIVPKKPPLISKIGLWESKVLRSPKDHLKPFGPNCSPHNSKQDTGSLPMLQQMEEVLHLRMGLPMYETLLLALYSCENC